jgi:adenine-specific DNA-methyltransferase
LLHPGYNRCNKTQEGISNMSGKEKQVKGGNAKGRPMLTWVGKKPLTSVRAWPEQHIESFSVEPPVQDGGDGQEHWADWPNKFPRGGLLFHGDNKDVLAHLLANGFRGKIKLIYIDPPFDSGADYVRKAATAGSEGHNQNRRRRIPARGAGSVHGYDCEL